MKNITLNGENFQIINKRDKDALKRRIERHKDNFTCKDIWDAYGRPSYTKVKIWEDWYDWYRDARNVSYFEVAGAGSHQFSIEGVVEIDGEEGLLRITKDYNRIEM